MKPYEVLIYYCDNEGNVERSWGPDFMFAHSGRAAERQFLLEHADDLVGVDLDELEVLVRPFV